VEMDIIGETLGYSIKTILNLRGIYAILWRELITFFRETPRFISSIVSPIIWLFIFGLGLGSSVVIVDIEYQKFIFAGILTQTFLFTSIFYGVYLVWDRRIDLLKSILVSPLSRTTIFLGKLLGGVTISLIESIIVLLLGLLIGINYTLFTFFATIAIVILASAIFTAIGLTIGSVLDSPEGFQLLSTFILFPLFFLSGALFPLDNLPQWLYVITTINPVSYVVDILRGILIGIHHVSIALSFSLILIFLVVTFIIGIESFKRMKA
jgi:ABC-2 type transport system permease protein